MTEVCPECNNNFSSEHGLKVHFGQAHPEKNGPFKNCHTCNECGSDFYTPKSRGNAKYCSQECYSDSGSIDKECNNCGDSFSITISNVESGGGRFCSAECMSDFLSVEKSCNNCGNNFSIPRSSSKKDAGKCCSQECYRENSKVEKVCKNCEDKFVVPRSHINRRTCCSRKCSAEHQSGSDRTRGGKEYKKWKQQVLERDNNSCQDCGSDENIECHHIVPIYKDESLATDVDNGIALCGGCHAGRHKELDDGVAELILSRNR